ncbi:MAG: FAD-binding oxidoreductase [Deltaproteobacteria bacterium]|nr:FAD-binding oxidoreductase [Deltaproteobacteria bacterium]
MVVDPGSPVQSARVVTDPDVLAAYTEDASHLRGSPEGLVRPDTAEEVAEALREAQGRGIAVTPCGLRSSTTGAGLAPRGWSLSTERLVGVEAIDAERRTAIVRAGTVLREFKDAVEEAGLFYPPDPTSERECAVGGTVACDASGARSYKYGATHRYVRGLEVALPDGSLRWYRRPIIGKDAAGYVGLRDPVRLFCGSEGTLGVVTRVEVDLLLRPEAFSAGLAFFVDVPEALAWVGLARSRESGVDPRCLELLDAAALRIMAAQGSGIGIPAEAGAAVFFEAEHRVGGEMAVMEAFWTLLSDAPGALADDTVIASDHTQQEQLRLLRHAVPATLNEEGRGHHASGGKKISTDWAVPFHHLAPFMKRVDGWLEDARIERVARYGHVGDGHPHYNLIVKDAEEAARAAVVVDRMCSEACALGGTVTAEHGVGKVKRTYAKYRFSDWQIASMKAVKAVFDPTGIMAPGNIWDES